MASSPNMPVGTAAVAWNDGTSDHIHVYSTDGYNVTERVWNGQVWADGSFKASGEQVSATCYQAAGTVRIRVYCNFEDKTTEYCSDDSGNTWYQGGYSPS